MLSVLNCHLFDFCFTLLSWLCLLFHSFALSRCLFASFFHFCVAYFRAHLNNVCMDFYGSKGLWLSHCVCGVRACVCVVICVSELGYFWVKVSPGFIIVWPGKAVRDLEACQGHAILKALSILIGAANVENSKASSDELLPGWGDARCGMDIGKV